MKMVLKRPHRTFPPRRILPTHSFSLPQILIVLSASDVAYPSFADKLRLVAHHFRIRSGWTIHLSIYETEALVATTLRSSWYTRNKVDGIRVRWWTKPYTQYVLYPSLQPEREVDDDLHIGSDVLDWPHLRHCAPLRTGLAFRPIGCRRLRSVTAFTSQDGFAELWYSCKSHQVTGVTPTLPHSLCCERNRPADHHLEV
ncbi:hypothetical protein BJV77DRAFT_59189 [Russula vinacea]|nr:hypothetical protein BJV77DRAFT_59189 [Russula vinacea]